MCVVIIPKRVKPRRDAPPEESTEIPRRAHEAALRDCGSEVNARSRGPLN